MLKKYTVTIKLVDVMSQKYVQATSLEEALAAGRKIKVPDIIGAKHEWIDGKLEVIGIDEC